MRLSALIAPLLAAGLAACGASHLSTARTPEEQALAASLESRTIVPTSTEQRSAIRSQDLLTQATFWAEAHELNPGDREAAVELSNVLRRLGNYDRAVLVARQARALFPNDRDVLFAYGAALAASGEGRSAIEPLARARALDSADWRISNALGVAYEQAGLPDEARRYYLEALARSPDEPSPLSNLALSYAMAGEPERAETLLRDAMSRPGAGPAIRQNLALVLALQGRFDEADRMARFDVTPAMAEANLAYVRSMLTSQRRWDAIRGDSGSN